MAGNDRPRSGTPDQEGKISELKQRVKEIAGGEMIAWESGTMSPAQREDFWRRILDQETLPVTTLTNELEAAGVHLPAPDAMSDEELTRKLWEVIRALARMRHFIQWTDHLSDRELYTALWSDVLPAETEKTAEDSEAFCCIDLIGTGSKEDNRLFMKYYADEEWRRQWLKEFPHDDMPAHEDPPYDRDRRLPSMAV